MKPCMSHGWRISLHPTTPRSRKAGFLGFLFLAVNPVVPAGLLQVIQGYGHGAHNLAGVGLLLTSSLPIQEGRWCLLQISPLGEKGDGGRPQGLPDTKGAALESPPWPGSSLPKLRSMCSQDHLGCLNCEGQKPT